MGYMSTPPDDKQAEREEAIADWYRERAGDYKVIVVQSLADGKEIEIAVFPADAEDVGDMVAGVLKMEMESDLGIEP